MKINLRRLSLQSTTILNICLFVAVIVTSTMLFKSFYIRFDVTSNNAFTLSEGTVRMVKALDDVLHLKVYLSQDLPPDYASTSREVMDVFEEFRAVGGRNVNLTFIDPGNDEELKAELNQMGILELRFNVRKRERFEQRTGYFSAAIFFRNRKEVIRNLTSEGSLELAIVRAIKKLTSVKTPKIAYVTNFGTEDPGNSYKLIYNKLLETHNIEKIELGQAKPIPADADILFIAGPTQKLTPWALYQVDQFVMNGGKLVAFLPRIALNAKFDGILKIDTELEKLLQHYGVTVNQDMVCDFDKMAYLPYSMGGQQVVNLYPPFVSVDRECFQKNLSAVTKGLQSVYITWGSSIDLNEEQLAGNKTEVLLESSVNSTVQKSNYTLDPSQMKNKNIGEKKARKLGVLVSGSQTSFYKGKDRPTPPAGGAPAPGKEEEKQKEYVETNEDAYITVVSNSSFSSAFILNMLRGRYRTNVTFVENLFEYLSLGNDLIGIRMKSPANQKVNERVLEDYKTLFWLLNIAMMPFFILLLGIAIKIISYIMKRNYESRVGR